MNRDDLSRSSSAGASYLLCVHSRERWRGMERSFGEGAVVCEVLEHFVDQV
jgi:hypothetical protein